MTIPDITRLKSKFTIPDCKRLYLNRPPSSWPKRLVIPINLLELEDSVGFVSLSKVDLEEIPGVVFNLVQNVDLGILQYSPDAKVLRRIFPLADGFAFTPKEMDLKDLKSFLRTSGPLQSLSLNLDQTDWTKEQIEELIIATNSTMRGKSSIQKK